jgi:hypothetical protein
MPYGMDKSIGGDTKEADKWMEGCVSKVMAKPDKNGKHKDKGSAIAICKATYEKSHGNTKTASFIVDQLFNKE